MNLTLINQDRITTGFLPEEISGKHWLEDRDGRANTRRLASIEAHEGSWVITPSAKCLLIADAKERSEDAELQSITRRTLLSGSSVHEFVTESGEHVILLANKDTEDSKTFTKVGFATDCTITIGREPNNLLSFENEYVSAHHAALVLKDESFVLEDKGSANGVYVNGKAILRHTPLTLCFGDIVFIMGLRIAIGKRFICFNNPEGAVTLAPAENQVYYTSQEYEREDCLFEPFPLKTFFRSPRIMREITPITLAIEDPPPAKEQQDTPTILKIGPSLGMALASAMMGFFTVSNILDGQGSIMKAVPTIGMMVVMILGAVLWPNLSRRYEKKKAAREESTRRATYAQYLDSIKRLLIAETHLQKDILEENRITTAECRARTYNQDRRLFDRSALQSDFL